MFDFFSSWYILASVIFSIVFYIPKWFELTYVKDLPRPCYKIKSVYECLENISLNEEKNVTKQLQINRITHTLTLLTNIYCWNRNDSFTEQVG